MFPYSWRRRWNLRTRPTRRGPMRFRPQVEGLEERVVPAVLMVLNTNDAGPCSLRAAITQANADTSADTIEFAQNLAGQTINLTTTDTTSLKGPGGLDATSARRRSRSPATLPSTAAPVASPWPAPPLRRPFASSRCSTPTAPPR